MQVYQWIGLLLIALLMELFYISKRRSQHTIHCREQYEKSYLFFIVLCVAAFLFQTLIDSVILPGYKLSPILVFLLLVYTFYQIQTGRKSGLCVLQSNHFYFALKYNAVFLIVLCWVFQSNPPRHQAYIQAQTHDGFLSSCLLVLLIGLILKMRIAFYQNGLVYGFVFIPWNRMQSWQWNPEKEKQLLISTDLFLYPYINIEFKKEQLADIDEVMRDNAPHAIRRPIEKSSTTDSSQIPTNPYFDAPE